MWSAIFSAIISVVTWIVDRSSKAKERAKKYLAYVAYWEKNHEAPKAISDDIDELLKKSDEI